MSALVIRRLRLGAGLVLISYLTTHFANHALGLISLGAMEVGRIWFLGLWRNPLMTAILYTSLVVHPLLALWSLYRRRHLRMPAWEAAQLVLGLTIPALLAPHVAGTRLTHALFGTTDSYTRLVLGLWHFAPWLGARQVILLLIAWTHGCIGLHFWLRLRPWYSRVALPLFAMALLLPVLALLGFAQAGREVDRLAETPGWVAGVARAAHAPEPAQRATLGRVVDGFLIGYAAALGGVLLARAERQRRARRRLIRITYPGGREVAIPAGFTVLEASRFAGIPHASVCGGRGRCSTCRIRVIRGLEALAPPSADELRVLERVGATPNVRLACQLRPHHALSIAPLLPAAARPRDATTRQDHRGGSEQEITVLFADLRGFTRIAEPKLPYDVVFLLNRYFDVVGGAIDRAGGTANQFTGDGVMALFGVDAGPQEGCRRALTAAREVLRSLDALNRELADELSTPLRMGIGIHTGPAVVGRMGYGTGLYLTAVGDTVNVAARLEQLTKEYDCPLVISEAVAARAGVDVSRFPRHELTVRNRDEPVAICVIADVADMPSP